MLPSFILSILNYFTRIYELVESNLEIMILKNWKSLRYVMILKFYIKK